MLGVFREDLAFSNAPKHCYYEPWVSTRLTKKLATNGIYSTALWLITFKMIHKIVGLVYNSICIVLSVTFFL